MFNYLRSRNGSTRNLTDPILIKTGVTVSVGEVVEVYTSGTVENGLAAKPLKGLVVDILDSKGYPFKKLQPSAGTAYSSDTITVTGDGTQYVILDTSLNSMYSVDVSGTLGTTANSDKLGGRIDVDSANTEYGQVLETTFTRTVATTANFYSHGVDPKDSTRLIVSLANSEEYSSPTTEA